MMTNRATILIPDISGYTTFLTTTELSHSTHIINELLEIILQSNREVFTLAEIEGDALLLYREGETLTREGLEQHCINMFKEFHRFLKVIERDRVCACGACQTATNLSLKFVAHYGEVNRIKIGSIVKPIGVELIVAHRLLKNSIDQSSYLLFTKKLLDNVADRERRDKRDQWIESSEEYPAVGKIDFEYRSLDDIKKHIPQAPKVEEPEVTPIDEFVEVQIDVPIRSLYETLIDHETKKYWVTGLKDVEINDVIQRVGSKHLCLLEAGSVDFQSVKADVRPQKIVYIEQARVRENGLNFFNHSELTALSESKTKLRSTIAPVRNQELPKEFVDFVLNSGKKDFINLKKYCEQRYNATP